MRKPLSAKKSMTPSWPAPAPTMFGASWSELQ
jgi:hypothetical protein